MKYIYNLKRDKLDERDRHFAHSISPVSSVKLPVSVDLRYKCPAVYDQGDLGSCTANAGCACRAMLANRPQLNLSRLFLYYEERNQDGTVQEDLGASVRDICKVVGKYGVCEEQFMPYNIEKFAETPSLQAIQNAEKYRINAYKKLNNVNEIKQSLALRQQPVLSGMDIYDSFESEEVAKTGILSMPKSTEENKGGHAVLIVGYVDRGGIFSLVRSVLCNDQSQGYFIVRNSWGNSWGEHGYFYMPYEYVNKGYAYDFWLME
jgi:C1A family cysteine protease